MHHDDDDDETRVAQTESLFREVNERIALSAEQFDGEEADFVCECADPACTERFEVTLAEYERVRAHATHFLLAPGHEDDRFERPVRRRRDWLVVDKFRAGVAAVARRLDPRAGTA